MLSLYPPTFIYPLAYYRSTGLERTSRAIMCSPRVYKHGSDVKLIWIPGTDLDCEAPGGPNPDPLLVAG